MFTTSDGRYESRDLEYGAKAVLVEAEGHVPFGATFGFYDGYGAEASDFVLMPEGELRPSFVDAVGAPAGSVDVRTLPRLWGRASSLLRTDERGKLEIPLTSWRDGHGPRLLLGSPPFLMDPHGLSADPESDVPWRLPPKSALRVRAIGAPDGPVQVELLPAGARRMGRSTMVLTSRDELVLLPPVYHGEYQLRLRQEDRVASIDVEHDGEIVEAHFESIPALEVRVRDEGGKLLDALVTWQEVSFGTTSAFSPDPFEANEQTDPSRIAVRTEQGLAQLPARYRRTGWLLVESEGFAPRTVPVDEPSAVTVELRRSMVASLRTRVPFEAVSVRVDGLPHQVGWSDAFAEANFDAVPGPAVLRQVFGGGTMSYPVGHWIGGHEPVRRFNVADQYTGSGGCVFGFVVDQAGRPVEGADVFLTSHGYPKERQSSVSGFFRFERVAAGSYSLSVRRGSEYSAVLHATPVVLPAAARRADRQVRVDLELWQGSIEVTGVPDAGAAELRLDHDTPIWRAQADEAGVARISNLAPGEYLTYASEEAGREARPLGKVSVASGTDVPVQIEWEVDR